MGIEEDYEFFRLRVAGKAYFSKVFTRRAALTEERVRYARMVLEDSDQLLVGEIEGALCLRLTGKKRKTQVSAIVTSDHQHIRRLTLETFQSRAGNWYQAYEKDSFSFRED